MNLGIPKEKRPYEYRVGLPPAGVNLFAKYGHTVFVEHQAGQGAGFRDDDYIEAGGTILYSDEEVFGRADLLLKFSRPLQNELMLMRDGQAVAGFLHLAAAREGKIKLIQQKSITAIAYEQIQEANGYRPCLAPLSEIGGRMAVQVAARFMQNDHGGRGILLGGVAGVPSAEVVIVGAGVVGQTAAISFTALGVQVTVLDIDLRRLRSLQQRCNQPLVTLVSTPYNIQRACIFADVLIGAVLVSGERAPIVVTRDMVASMKPRSVILDLSIDQGGCIETSRPTHHGSPTYIEEGVIHYCVPNMSGVLGRTATHALFYGAYPYLEKIAKYGTLDAIEASDALGRGVNFLQGEAVHLKRLSGFGGVGQ